MEYNKIIYGEIKFVTHSVYNGSNCSNHHNIDNTSNNINGAIINHAPSNGTHPSNGTTTAAATTATTNGSHGSPISSKPTKIPSNDNELASFKAPRQSLSDPNSIKLDWPHSEKIGGGLINVGNTCFLNSVLQCLTYCPPLYNYLIKQNGGHSSTCKLNQFCMLCEMEKHIKRIKTSNGQPIKPISIVHRLKFINKSFQFGRQEDAHEFLRYLIDHMWKACLMNLDVNVKSNNTGDKIDPRIKETTAINHIFGGYHRSQVLCLSCNSRSNTFDFFMDFILDIRNAKSLEDSLRKFTQPETLEHENAYKCSRCKRKVTARKRFSVYKAPNVATFQLKRFDSDRIYGGKITKYVSYPEELDLRPYMSDSTKAPIKYHLSAVLVHVGYSSNSGHYFCFIKNSNGFWYKMDDSQVTVVNKSIVLQQQAYILFYTKRPGEPIKNQTISNGIEKTIKPPLTSLTTWLGVRSKLEDEDVGKRKLNEVTERDKFNEELDQGKTKKIKSYNREEKFNNLSKLNFFQRFNDNNAKKNVHHLKQNSFRHKQKFNYHGKHKNKKQKRPLNKDNSAF